MTSSRREGDWDCESCGKHNFAFRDSCFECGRGKFGKESRRSTSRDRRRSSSRGRSDSRRNNSRRDTRPGDWTCDSCGGHNFAFRNECFDCRAPKSRSDYGGGYGGGRSSGGRNEPKAGDWMCECGQHNFASRTECFKCGASDRFATATFEGDNDRRSNYGDDRRSYNGEDRRGNFDQNTRPGDWWCEACRCNNFASRSRCFKCNVPKGKANMRKGDWMCPECNNHNFAFRDVCKNCPEKKPLDTDGFVSPLKSRPGDWECLKCSANNFAFRTECFKCNEPKDGDEDEPDSDDGVTDL